MIIGDGVFVDTAPAAALFSAAAVAAAAAVTAECCSCEGFLGFLASLSSWKTTDDRLFLPELP
jgi:hypothetical protein